MLNSLKLNITLFLVLLVASIAQSSVNAAPASQRIEIWNAYDADSAMVVEHSVWQLILDKYLDDQMADGISRFAYAKVSSEDSERLASYLASLQDVDPRRLNKNEQLAYWINFYNAGTVKVVLDAYPVKSIRNIRPSFFALSRGPWDHAYFSIGGHEVTLNDIEHGILRPIWQDFRLHFVLNCASIGCPNLSKQAFTANNSEEQLEAATVAFLNHERAVSVKDKTLMLSSLFDWYADDFGNDLSEIIELISEYNNEHLQIAADLESYNVKFHYDWGLNQQ